MAKSVYARSRSILLHAAKIRNREESAALTLQQSWRKNRARLKKLPKQVKEAAIKMTIGSDWFTDPRPSKAEIEAAELAELAALAAEKEMSNYDPVDEEVDDMAPSEAPAPVAVAEAPPVPAPAPAPAPAPKPPVDDDIFGELGI